MAYSYLGFHGYALGAIEQARQVGAAAGIPEETFAAPGIRLRNAVALDHHGDSDGCLRVLRDIAADLARFVAHRRAAGRLRPSSLRRVRLRAGPPGRARRPAATDGDPIRPGCSAAGGDSARARDLRQLGEVCLAIADGRPIEAVARLDTVTVSAETLGAAEPARLRSIAYPGRRPRRPRTGPTGYAFRLAAQRNDRLRDVYVDGVAARIDHEEMRREAARYEDEALTDPLTGLPNRRQLERYVAAMVARGERAVIGVCDLDGFKAVNTRARPPLRRPGAAAHRRGAQPGDAPRRLRGPVRRRRVRGGAAGRRHGRGRRDGPPDQPAAVAPRTGRRWCPARRSG